MKLSDTNKYIKDNLYNFIDMSMKTDDKAFTTEQLEKLIEMSFVFNNITSNDESYIIFDYNGTKIKIRIDDPYQSEESILMKNRLNPH